MKVKTKEWRNSGGVSGNQVLSCDDFYVSFCADPTTACLGSFFASSDNGEPETALCKDGDFFILNGDYRAEYEDLADDGFEACKAFFEKQRNRSSWSN